MQKVLTIGSNSFLLDEARKVTDSEVFSAEDLCEAKSILTSSDGFDFVLLENTFSPADVEKFLISVSPLCQTAVLETNQNGHSRQDYLPLGIKHYVSDKSCIGKLLQSGSSSSAAGSKYFVDEFAESMQIAGRSEAVIGAMKMLRLVACSNCNPVLIIGHTGSGKESAAKAVHCLRCPDKPFVAVNCAALTATLLESELFGHCKGAFTGADRDKTGLLELAEDGTIFLDEISEIPPELQAKLLRVLQEKTFRKVGSTGNIKCRATIVASSNRNLKKDVEEKKFRQDLYYRLNTCPIVLSPLASPKRRSDIPLLAEYFLLTSSIYPQKSKKIKGFTSLAIQTLVQHNWPGNVRELKNVIERAILLESGTQIGIDSIVLDPAEENQPQEMFDASPAGANLKDFSIAAAEKELIKRALSEASGQKSRAAGLLGITRATLYAKLKQYELENGHPSEADACINAA